MFRKGLSCFCRTPRDVNFMVSRRPLTLHKVGIVPTSAKSFKSQRIYSPLGEDICAWKSFHVSVKFLSLSDQEIKNHMNGITDKFTEAMELLSDAASSKGTVYFSEDMTDAEALIEDVLKEYEHFLGLLSDDQARNVVRSIGLKMEELKAQLQLLKDSVKE